MPALEKDKILRYEAEIKEARSVLIEITSGDIDLFLRDSIKIRAL